MGRQETSQAGRHQDANHQTKISDLYPVARVQRDCLRRPREHVGRGKVHRTGTRSVAGRTRLPVLFVPVGLCTHDAAGRPIDRPLGRTCNGNRSHSRVVGRADGDRRRRGRRDDAARPARSGCGRGAVLASGISQRPCMGALFRARHGHRFHWSRRQPGSGNRRTACRLAHPNLVVALVLRYHRRSRLRLGCGLAGPGIDTGEDEMAAGAGTAAHLGRARGRHRGTRPRRCRLSRAAALPGNVGPVRLAGLPGLFALSVPELAAELPADIAGFVAG